MCSLERKQNSKDVGVFFHISMLVLLVNQKSCPNGQDLRPDLVPRLSALPANTHLQL